jgi:choloylglycine hydrolase
MEPSFMRAAAFSQAVLPSQTGNEAVLEAFHILNAFDIPKGAARDQEKDEHVNLLADHTIWTSANDLAVCGKTWKLSHCSLCL